MARLLARAAFGAVIVLLWFGTARAATPAGSVVAISGLCFVEADGKRTPLKFGDKVNVADTVDVPAGAKLKLRMADGSILSVAGGSQLRIAAYTLDPDGKRHDVELSLGQGLMRAVVAPIDRPAKFEVKTAIAAAAVRSTDWFIEAQPGVATLAVLAGGVVLTSNATNASVLVPAHSGSTVEVGRDPSPPRKLRQAEFNALIARTEPPARRRATQPAEPTQGYNPPPSGPPGGDGPPPGGYSGPPPDQYGPGPGGPGPPPGGGYYPYPGGFPPGGGGDNPRPGGTYQPPSGGRGGVPGAMPSAPAKGTHPN